MCSVTCTTEICKSSTKEIWYCLQKRPSRKSIYRRRRKKKQQQRANKDFQFIKKKKNGIGTYTYIYNIFVSQLRFFNGEKKINQNF